MQNVPVEAQGAQQQQQEESTALGTYVETAMNNRWALALLTMLGTLATHVGLRLLENEFLSGVWNCLKKLCCGCRKRRTMKLSAVICKSGHVVHLFESCKTLGRVDDDRKKSWPVCEKCQGTHWTHRPETLPNSRPPSLTANTKQVRGRGPVSQFHLWSYSKRLSVGNRPSRASQPVS